MLLETLREYALHQLQRRGELQLARERHARLFADRVARALDDRSSVREIDRMLPDIEAALAWLIDHDVDAGISMAINLAELWHSTGQNGLLVSRLGQYAKNVTTGSVHLRARFKTIVGTAYVHCFNIDTAHDLLNQSLALYNSGESRDQAEVADVQLQLFWLAHERATPQDLAFMAAISAQWEADWRAGIPMTTALTFALSFALAKQMRTDDASRVLEGALQAATLDADRASLKHALCGIRWTQGRIHDVLDLTRDTCRSFEELNDKRSLPVAYSFQGLARIKLGDIAGALQSCESALQIAEENDNTFLVHLVLHHRAMARAANNEPDLAFIGFNTALSWARSNKHTALVARCLLGIAGIHLQIGELERGARNCVDGFRLIDGGHAQLSPVDVAPYEELRAQFITALGESRYAALSTDTSPQH
jgi:tetratricopeptide (TPR) repeat protein